ncbi:MAG: hypothetical protein EPN94_03680 [Nitrospirae bacterium]|nr:MAG: hypothetical protein EPN94_03680 [Nitrospirota bacterium]
MPVCVRLDRETEELLEKAARLSKTTKSAMVKKSIKEFCAPIVKEQKRDLSELIKELIKDHPGSGRGDLASRSEEILRERFKRKH